MSHERRESRPTMTAMMLSRKLKWGTDVSSSHMHLMPKLAS